MSDGRAEGVQHHLLVQLADGWQEVVVLEADPTPAGVDPGFDLVIIVAGQSATIRMACLLGPLVVVGEAGGVHAEEALHGWLRHP